MGLASIYPVFAAPFTRPEPYWNWFFENLHFSTFPFIFSFAVTLFSLTFEWHITFQKHYAKWAVTIMIFFLFLASIVSATDAASSSLSQLFNGKPIEIFKEAGRNIYAKDWDFKFRKLWNTTAIFFSALCFWHLTCLVIFKLKLSQRNIRQICLAVAMIGLWFPARLYPLWLNYKNTAIFKNYTALTVAMWAFAISMLFVGILIKRLQGEDKKLYIVCIATPFVVGQVFALDKFMGFIPESFSHAHIGGKFIVLVLIILMLTVIAYEMDVFQSNRLKANKANSADAKRLRG